MKHINYLLSLLLLISFMGFMSCGGDDPETPSLEEERMENLVGLWSTGSVTLNGNPAPGDWSNFTINFTAQQGVSVTGDPKSEVDIFDVTTYDIVNSGTSATSFEVFFNGEQAENAQININGTNMTMTFTLDEGDKLGSRILSVEGTWVFNLTK